MQLERHWRGSILGGTGPQCGPDTVWSRGRPHVLLTALSLSSPWSPSPPADRRDRLCCSLMLRKLGATRSSM